MKKLLLYLLSGICLTLFVSACNAKAEETPKKETNTPIPEATSSPEPTTQNEPTSIPTDSPANDVIISDDVFSFEAALDGVVYHFPMKFSDFLSSGWTFSGDFDKRVSSYSYEAGSLTSKNGISLFPYLMNADINSCEINKSYIAGFQLDREDITNKSTEVILPHRLSFLTVTEEELTTAFGEPSKVSSDSDYRTLLYQRNDNISVAFNFSLETKELSRVAMHNLVTPEGFTSSAISEKTPVNVRLYEAPDSISSDLFDYEVVFEGRTLRLPAPVSEILRCGFTIDKEASDSFIAGEQPGSLTLVKGDFSFQVYVQNYSENSTTMENSFLCYLNSYQAENENSLTLSGGIKAGMSEASLQKALEGYEVSVQEEGDITKYYVIEDTEADLGYRFHVQNEVVTYVGIFRFLAYRDFALPEDYERVYIVELTGLADGGSSILLIKAVREMTGFGLADAKDVVDNLPKKLMVAYTKKKADQLANTLKEAGGLVEIH